MAEPIPVLPDSDSDPDPAPALAGRRFRIAPEVAPSVPPAFPIEPQASETPASAT
jgi:hypothetical protein